MTSKQKTARLHDWETVALAIVLMITGFVLLGGDFVGMLSLERIQNFWPVALIAVGLAELPAAESPTRG